MQADIARELINTNDATTIGVLLAFIAILIFAIVMMWRKSAKDEDYIRSQDKANLEMLSSLTKASEALGLDIMLIKDYTVTSKPKLDRLLEIIKDRLEKR